MKKFIVTTNTGFKSRYLIEAETALEAEKIFMDSDLDAMDEEADEELVTDVMELK